MNLILEKGKFCFSLTVMDCVEFIILMLVTLVTRPTSLLLEKALSGWAPLQNLHYAGKWWIYSPSGSQKEAVVLDRRRWLCGNCITRDVGYDKLIFVCVCVSSPWTRSQTWLGEWMKSVSSYQSLSGSDWLGTIAAGDTSGELIAAILPDMATNPITVKRPVERRFVRI